MNLVIFSAPTAQTMTRLTNVIGSWTEHDCCSQLQEWLDRLAKAEQNLKNIDMVVDKIYDCIVNNAIPYQAVCVYGNPWHSLIHARLQRKLMQHRLRGSNLSIKWLYHALDGEAFLIDSF